MFRQFEAAKPRNYTIYYKDEAGYVHIPNVVKVNVTWDCHTGEGLAELITGSGTTDTFTLSEILRVSYGDVEE